MAVLGGGGDFALYPAMEAGADALVTGEAKHHILLDAHSSGFTFVDAGHFDTEKPSLPRFETAFGTGVPANRIYLSGFSKSSALFRD